MACSVQFWEGAREGEPSQWPRGDGKIASVGVHNDGGDLAIDRIVRYIFFIIIVELRG
jgi:hypothetical protein